MTDRRQVSPAPPATILADGAALWRVSIGGDRVIEMSVAEIAQAFRRGELSVRTPIWPPGLSGWQALGNFGQFLDCPAHSEKRRVADADGSVDGEGFMQTGAADAADFAVTGRPPARVQHASIYLVQAEHGDAADLATTTRPGAPILHPPTSIIEQAEPAQARVRNGAAAQRDAMSQPDPAPFISFSVRPTLHTWPRKAAPVIETAPSPPTHALAPDPAPTAVRALAPVPTFTQAGPIALVPEPLATQASAPAVEPKAASAPAELVVPSPSPEFRPRNRRLWLGAGIAGLVALSSAAAALGIGTGRAPNGGKLAPTLTAPTAQRPTLPEAMPASASTATPIGNPQYPALPTGADGSSGGLIASAAGTDRPTACANAPAGSVQAGPQRTKELAPAKAAKSLGAKVNRTSRKPALMASDSVPIAPPSTEQAVQPEPAGSSDGESDPSTVHAEVKDAASKALASAVAMASQCRPKGEPSGTGEARVVYSPDGSVRSVEILTAKFRDTVTASCVRILLRRTKIPAFDGEPAEFITTFTIPPQ